MVFEKSLDACEIQYREQVSLDSPEYTPYGPPEPCQGGLVTVDITAQTEANAQVARVSRTSASAAVNVVSLTGDSATDEAAIVAQMATIHAAHSGNSPPLKHKHKHDKKQTHRSSFMSPEALETLVLEQNKPAISLAPKKQKQNCKSGPEIGTRRDASGTIKADGAGARVKFTILYKRSSCVRWRVTDVQMDTVQAKPLTNVLWFRNFYYNAGGEYWEAGKQCWEIKDNKVVNFRPGWDVVPNGGAQIELVDQHPHPLFGGVDRSCWGGAGTSYVSLWVALPGASR